MYLVQIRHWKMIQQLDFPPKFLHRLQRIFVPQSLRLLLIYKNKIMFQHLASFLDSVLLCNARIRCAKINNQRFLNAEDCIRGLVRVVADVKGSGEEYVSISYTRQQACVPT